MLESLNKPKSISLLAVPGSALRLDSSASAQAWQHALTDLLGGAVLPTILFQQSISLLCALDDLLHLDLAIDLANDIP